MHSRLWARSAIPQVCCTGEEVSRLSAALHARALQHDTDIHWTPKNCPLRVIMVDLSLRLAGYCLSSADLALDLVWQSRAIGSLTPHAEA